MLRDIDMRSYITKKARIKSSTFFPASLSAIDIIRRKQRVIWGLYCVASESRQVSYQFVCLLQSMLSPAAPH